MDLLARLQKVRRSGEGWTAVCPGHDDRNPSLAIGQGDDGRWLLTCHAGCDLDRILAALGLEAKDLFPDRDHTPPSRIVTVYDYDGVFEVVRYSPKSFRQRRPDGNSGYVWSVKGLAPRVYHQSDLTGQPVVVVCEGEKDVDRLWALGVPATCNAGGAGKWKKEHADQLVEAGVTHVHVIPDNDQPGRAHAAQVARLCAEAGLTVKILDLSGRGCGMKDVSDWLDAGATKADLFSLIETTDVYTPTDTPEGETEGHEDTDDVDVPVVVHLVDVQPEAVDWVWLRRFARGKLTIVAGEPGTGKSTAMLDLAARVTRGANWPDDGQAPRGAILLLNAEDGLADTVRPKLDACDGDATLVDVLTAVKTTDGAERHFDLGRDMGALEAAMRQRDPVLVVIDPLSAYLGTVDSWRDAEVRGVLAPLASLAERHGCAIVAVLHLTKNQGAKVLNRVMGSIGFVAAARIVLAVTHDPDNESRHLLLPVKSNLAPPADALAFSRDGDRVVWEDGPVEGVTIDGVMAESPMDRGERDDAEDFLRQLLSADPVPATSAIKLARANGIAERTLRRAKVHLGITSRRTGGVGEKGTWNWHLPLSATGYTVGHVAALDDEAQENTIKTDPNSKTANTDMSGHVSGHVSEAGHVSSDAKAATVSKAATNMATQKKAVLEETLNKETKASKAATFDIDEGDTRPPTSLLDSARPPFVFDPKAAFASPDTTAPDVTEEDGDYDRF